MPKNIYFSGQNLTLTEIANYYRSVQDAIYYYFDKHHNLNNFLFYTIEEIENEKIKILDELEKNCVFMVLASLEASFRIDYLQRCLYKYKDPISKKFRSLYKKYEERVSLEDEILKTWKDYNEREIKNTLCKLIEAFKYRHWLAHGRYWKPKLGSKIYDFSSVYILAKFIYENLEFYI